MTDRVTEYAQNVMEGKYTVGQLHRLACKRHLDNLAASNDNEYPYYWDVNLASEVISFFETLTIGEGAEPKPLRLLDCQAFDIGCTFGWKKKANGKRRFRRRYKSIARQNGKTMENGGMGTYLLGFSDYKYGKLFAVATKKRQARLAWEETKKFIESDKELKEFFSIKDYKSTILANHTECTFEALSKEAGLDDGFRSIFASIDELHQHKDNKIYKAIYNGTRALPETLVSMITTRGDNLNSFCKEMDDYAVNVLNGTAVADDMFIDIYCLDDDDDIWDESNWIKANPFICSDKERMNSFRNDARTAKDMGGTELRDFLTKCLNMWVQNTDDQYINTEKWKLCATSKTLEDMRGRKCYVGLDLSSGGDLTSLALEFPLDNDTAYVYSHSFMPRGRLQEHIETDLAPYDLWELQGLLTITGGEGDFKNDYKFIIKHLKEIKEKYGLEFLGIGIDPHNADGVLADLDDFGCDVIVVTQSAKSLNDATVDFQLAVKSESIEYDEKNELLTWSMVNAAVVRNSFGEIKVDKKPQQKYKRIDVVDAVIDAHSLTIKNKDTYVDLSDEMDKYLEQMGW